MKKTENLRFVFSRPTLLMFVTGREAPLDQRNRKPPPPPRAQFTFRFPFLFSFSLFFFLVFSFFVRRKNTNLGFPLIGRVTRIAFVWIVFFITALTWSSCFFPLPPPTVLAALTCFSSLLFGSLLGLGGNIFANYDRKDQMTPREWISFWMMTISYNELMLTQLCHVPLPEM